MNNIPLHCKGKDGFVALVCLFFGFLRKSGSVGLPPPLFGKRPSRGFWPRCILNELDCCVGHHADHHDDDSGRDEENEEKMFVIYWQCICDEMDHCGDHHATPFIHPAPPRKTQYFSPACRFPNSANTKQN